MKTKILVSIICLATLISCGPDKKSPEYIAKEYLTALKNKDWEKAKKYSTKEAAANIDLFASLGGDFHITEIKDIQCKRTSRNHAICTFCCSEDTGFKQIYLIMEDNGQWLPASP